MVLVLLMVFDYLKMEMTYFLEVYIKNNYTQCSYREPMPIALGSEKSPPAMLPGVCIARSSLPQHQGRVNISWDPLPCHLQNGADVTSYIIRYTHLSTGVAARITSSHSAMNCSQEVGGLYSCVVAESLIPSDQAYSIQVAAVNSFGEGDPINVSLPVSSIL